jgi:hypothetical protein
MMRISGLLLAAAPFCLVAACVAPAMAPTVQATPGYGKSAADFSADAAACQGYAQQVASSTSAAATNQALATTVANFSAGSATIATAGTNQPALQQQYDAYYSQCMYTRGETVPGYGPVYAEPETRHRVYHRPASSSSSGEAASAPASSSASFVTPAPSGNGGFVTPAPSSSSGGSSSSGFAVPAPAH